MSTIYPRKGSEPSVARVLGKGEVVGTKSREGGAGVDHILILGLGHGNNFEFYF